MTSSFRFPSPTSRPTIGLHKAGTPNLDDKVNIVVIIIAAILAALVVLAGVALLVWKLRGSYNASRLENFNTKRVIVIPVSPRPYPDEYGARNHYGHVEPQVNIYRPQEYVL